MKYKVRDGYVEYGDEFWWLYEGGPEKVDSSNWEDHGYNLKDYPEVYQIKEPVYKVIQEGIYEGEFVYEHEERFKLMNQGKHATKKPKTERKRPEFTFEELCFMLDVSPTKAGVMFACMLHNIHHYAQCVACKTILSGWKTKHYADKPLRKKLKLYVKWLQSEMSKQESSK